MSARSNAHGMVAVCLAMAIFVLSDACTKTVTATLPLTEAICLRNGIGFLMLAALIAGRGEAAALPRMGDPLVLLRGLADTAGTFVFLTALSTMSLGDVTAIQQIVPLLLTAIGIFMLSERVEPRRILAVLLGFGGALLIADPRGSGFGLGALLAFTTAGAVVVRDLLVRRIDRAIPPLVLVLGSIWLSVPIAPLVGFGSVWHWPTGMEFGLMVGAAAGLCIAQVAIALALRWAEVRALAPFYYSQTIFAVAATYGLFGVVPSLGGAVGIALVVGAGLYVVLRERREAAIGSDIALESRAENEVGALP